MQWCSTFLALQLDEWYEASQQALSNVRGQSMGLIQCEVGAQGQPMDVI